MEAISTQPEKQKKPSSSFSRSPPRSLSHTHTHIHTRLSGSETESCHIQRASSFGPSWLLGRAVVAAFAVKLAGFGALLCAARRRRVHMSAAPQQAQLTSRSRSVLGKRFNSFGSGRFNPFPAWPRGKRRHWGGDRGDGHGESAPSAFNRLWLSCCVEAQVRLSPEHTRPSVSAVCLRGSAASTYPTPHPTPPLSPTGTAGRFWPFKKARHVTST